MAHGLAYIQGDNTTVMGVDDKNAVPVNGLRNSCVSLTIAIDFDYSLQSIL